MKCFQFQCFFPYSWEDITKANWNKYPNEVTSHVVSVDVLRRELVQPDNVLRTERLIGVHQPIPRWLSKLLCSDGMAYCREVSEVNLKTGTLILRTRNIDHASVLTIMETVKYKRDHHSPLENTFFSQKAFIRSELSIKPISNRLEQFSFNRFGQNAQLGREALSQVLEQPSTYR